MLPFLDALDARADVAIGLLFFPRLVTRAAQFDAFAERVRRADHARRPDAAWTSPPSPSFLIAAFFTQAAPDTFRERRRSSCPSCRRYARSDAAARAHVGAPPRDGREGRASPRRRPPRRNFETVNARGAAAVDAVLRDLRRDRRSRRLHAARVSLAARPRERPPPAPIEPDTRASSIARPEAVGRFVLIGLLGRGGMG